MSDIKICATDTASSYPKGKVIGVYGLLGGAIGSLIVFVPVIVINTIINTSLDIIEIVKIVASVSMIGMVVGLLPSIVAGIIICKFKLYFDSAEKIWPLFAIGLFSTFIICVAGVVASAVLPARDLENGAWSFIFMIILCLPIGVLGGASAIITGLIALPKHK